MSAVHQRTTIEFFGGPCDGHQCLVSHRIDYLKRTVLIPLPFEMERSWLRSPRLFRARDAAIYALDQGPERCGYHYLGKLRRGSDRPGRTWERLIGWVGRALKDDPRVSARSTQA